MKPPDPIQADPSKTDPYGTLEVVQRACPQVIEAAHGALRQVNKDEPLRLAILDSALEIIGDPIKRAEFDGIVGLEVGKPIGNYTTLEKIAEGGFGSTYKATHRLTGCPVCIKHAHHISAADEAILMEEARICWDLRHWGIPAIRNIIRMSDDSLAIVMSYIPGPTLVQVREMPAHHGGIEPEHVAWITDRMLNILKYLHFEGVMHGDVKPANVIIQPESHTVTLVDYGLSALRPKRSDTVKGYTPFYASPEQMAGQTLTPECDFFGLGMTMIYALGGSVETIKVPGTTPPEMCKFIKRLIRRDADARPHWQDEDLCHTIHEVREKDFGRKMSGMKPLF